MKIMNVLMFVPTLLMEPVSVVVTLDTHWMMIDIHAMVRH